MKTLFSFFTVAQLAVVVSAIGVCFSGATPAQAATITPKSQARSVQAAVSWSGTPQSSTAKANGYGLFNKTLNYGGGAGGDTYQVQAVQTSQVAAAAITATGGVINRLGHAFASDANAQSDFKVTFRLTQAVDYTLAGSVFWDEYLPDTTSLAPSVTLTGPQGLVYQVDNVTSDGLQVDYSTMGVLPPGEYVLEAHAASLIPYAGFVAYKNFDLAFAVRPVGQPQPGAGQVYQLNGALIGLTEASGAVRPVMFYTHDLVNLALDKPAGSVPRNEVLALVCDNIDHSLRIAVWDIKAGAVTAELGPLVLAGGFTKPSGFTSIGDLAFGKIGRLLDTLDGVPSMLTMAATGTFDPVDHATVDRLITSPSIGQINFLDEAGANQKILVNRGSFVTGRKLGTTP